MAKKKAPPAKVEEKVATDVVPKFRRNPDNTIIYAPLIDVRSAQWGLHLLTFVPPAATPVDVVIENGKPILDIRATSEILVPLGSVERLIRDLSKQLKVTLMKRLQADAAQSGLEVDADSIEWRGLEDIMAVAEGRPTEG
jgi:hypothetical protein